MADRFDEVTGKLAKIGIGQIPVLGLVFEVATAFLPPNADARLKAAVEADIGATLSQLDAKVERLVQVLAANGMDLDKLGPVHTIGLVRELAESTINARSRVKREALADATVHQFDPRKGEADLRDHWLKRVRETSDAELVLVKLLVEHGELTFLDNAAYATADTNTADNPATESLGLPKASVVALETLAQRIADQGAGQLVYVPNGGRNVKHPTTSKTHGLRHYRLTAAGEVLASFIKPD